jgi:2-polyprenyl-3-methyl-5-hydroxy-6-metoxy-1,4-benzoquinol methylase
MKADHIRAAKYWERAGELGYAEAMFASEELAHHVSRRLWNIAIDIGKELGLASDAHVLDLGCGDGAFASLALAQHFGKVDGLDMSQAGIRRAQAQACKERMHFEVCDITQIDFAKRPHYDGVFLIGILHHVKTASPAIVRGLRTITNRVIVLEPNGSHFVRKLLELTPTYRAAGEDSFRTRELEEIFVESGFHKAIWQRRNLFPNFTPEALFRTLLPFEWFIESTPILRALCTVNMWGFVVEERAHE